MRQLLLAGFLVMAGTSCAPGEAEPGDRPNIIFIMTDDQSPIVPLPEDAKFDFSDGNGRGIQSHPFGFSGDREVYTPTIDELAAKGIIFSRAYVSSSVCAPSRYTTLTGRYAGRCEGKRFGNSFPKGSMTRIENNTELEEDRVNLPRLLQSAGYRTGFVGKSHVVDHHLINNPDLWKEAGLESYDQGADPRDNKVSEAMAKNHDFWAKRICEFGFDYANGVHAANLKELRNDSLNVHNLEWRNQAALEFLDGAGEEPFFLYYSESVPHGPAPWIYENGKYAYGLDSNPHFTGEGYVKEGFSNMPGREKIKNEAVAAGIHPDHAWLTWFDHAVGAVIDKLKEKGELENTLIVITSDHGNYNYGKSTLYEGGVKIPLMMYWPDGIKPGTRYDELVQNIDFAPTFLELAGLDLSSMEDLDGKSLKGTFGGDPAPVHEALFFEIGFARGVMTRDWKYIAVRYDEETEKQVEKGTVFTGWNGHTYTQPYYIRNTHLGWHAALLNEHYFERDQLYDMNLDSREKYNVIHTYPQKALEMRSLLEKSLKSFPDRPFGEFNQFK